MANPLVENANFGIVEVSEFFPQTDEQWEAVIEAVDYPVEIRDGFFADGEDTVKRAVSETNTGRASVFNFVVVDKLKEGRFTPISCVTDTYGTMKTASAYEDLKQLLTSIEANHRIKELYVSGNGGSQRLMVELTDLVDMTNLPDKIGAVIAFNSSVDGTKSHTINFMVYNKTTDAVFDFAGSVVKLSARHTTTIVDRTIDFGPAVIKLIKEWNDNVIPYMAILNDMKFDPETAKKLVEAVSEKAGIGERHRSKIVGIYGTSEDRTNATDDSAFHVMNTITQYINDELRDKPEQKDRFLKGVAKAMKNVDGLVKKVQKEDDDK